MSAGAIRRPRHGASATPTPTLGRRGGGVRRPSAPDAVGHFGVVRRIGLRSVRRDGSRLGRRIRGSAIRRSGAVAPLARRPVGRTRRGAAERLGLLRRRCRRQRIRPLEQRGIEADRIGELIGGHAPISRSMRSVPSGATRAARRRPRSRVTSPNSSAKPISSRDHERGRRPDRSPRPSSRRRPASGSASGEFGLGQHLVHGLGRRRRSARGPRRSASSPSWRTATPLNPTSHASCTLGASGSPSST